MNQFEQFNNYMAYNQAPSTIFLGGFSYLDNFCDNKQPVNFINEKLNNENKEFNSKIFTSAKVKSSDCSETLSIYANAEEETGSHDSPASKGYVKGEDHSLLNMVLKEIKSTPLDDLLEEWWVSKEIKDPVKNSEKIRFKNTKTPEQLAALEETLIKFPFKFPKRERVKFAKSVGLDEVQVYKWYYDNNPNKRGRKSQKGFEAFDAFSF